MEITHPEKLCENKNSDFSCMNLGSFFRVFTRNLFINDLIRLQLVLPVSGRRSAVSVDFARSNTIRRNQYRQ
jgi:hypothetical protein